jgi:hypothetical protein
MDAWNPYPTKFTGASNTTCYISNYITIQVTNNYDYGVTTNLTNVCPATYPTFNNFSWAAWQKGNNDPNGFTNFILTNINALAPCYFSEYYQKFIYFTNGPWTNQFLAVDTNQSSTTTGYPVHYWTLNITNHLVYALFDGTPTSGALLDFVNLGPFGSSVNIQRVIETNFSNPLSMTGSPVGNPWLRAPATDQTGSPLSQGLTNQILYTTGNSNYYTDLNGVSATGGKCDSGSVFGPPYEPSNVLALMVYDVANDPLVHYTIDDLTMPNAPGPQSINIPISAANPYPLLTNNLGKVNTLRYCPWGAADNFSNNMLLKDPLMSNSVSWAFPTNKFPGVGWIGRVHRGTPWQTVYLKPDNPSAIGTQTGDPLNELWTNWSGSPWFDPNDFILYETAPETYPTND